MRLTSLSGCNLAVMRKEISCDMLSMAVVMEWAIEEDFDSFGRLLLIMDWFPISEYFYWFSFDRDFLKLEDYRS